MQSRLVSKASRPHLPTVRKSLVASMTASVMVPILEMPECLETPMVSVTIPAASK
jgi:hypothetical protein